MRLINPTVVDSQVIHTRAGALTSLSGLTIGLLSNGKQNADVLLEKTAASLQQRYGGKVLPCLLYTSPSPRDS